MKGNRVKQKCVVCDENFYVIPSRKLTAKYCSNICKNNRKRSNSELKKISEASKQKFIDNPELRNICSENGKKAMKYINDTGKNFIMPVGYHTEEHKKYMSELMTDRYVSDETKLKIKENHWSNSDNADDIISKIKKSKEISEKWNSD